MVTNAFSPSTQETGRQISEFKASLGYEVQPCGGWGERKKEKSNQQNKRIGIVHKPLLSFQYILRKSIF